MDGDVFLWTVLLVLAAGIAGYAMTVIPAARRKARVVVDETQIGLRIVKGVVAEVLKPGEYSTWLTTDRIELVDMREQSIQINGQEVLTRDLLQVKFSLVGRYRIADPKLHRTAHAYPASRMYEDIQLELRRRTALVSLDEIMAEREKVMAGFVEAIASGIRTVGIELIDVQLRDLVLAGPAKQAFADIWKAQKDGQAALERARAEQASLRSLANAARMLKGNPELMNLRLLQALQTVKSPTIVLGGGNGLLPVSGDAGATPEVET